MDGNGIVRDELGNLLNIIASTQVLIADYKRVLHERDNAVKRGVDLVLLLGAVVSGDDGESLQRAVDTLHSIKGRPLAEMMVADAVPAEGR